MKSPITIDQLIPGGIRPDDHVHVHTNDGTCSRCRREVPEDDVPLTLWNDTAERMWIYCESCLAGRWKAVAMPIPTIPGTHDDYVRCSYDELCRESREAIDAVVNSHALGSRIDGDTALMLLRFLGMCDAEAADLLADARHEASQP